VNEVSQKGLPVRPACVGLERPVASRILSL
jgi:hypothetical protein